MTCSKLSLTIGQLVNSTLQAGRGVSPTAGGGSLRPEGPGDRGPTTPRAGETAPTRTGVSYM